MDQKNDSRIPPSARKRVTYQLCSGQRITTPWGLDIRMQGKQMVANLREVPSVGIVDIDQVIAHQMLRVADFTSHSLTFRNGGQLDYARNDRGELVSLRGRDVAFEIDTDGSVLVRMPLHPSAVATVTACE